MKLDYKKILSIFSGIFLLYLCIHYWDGFVGFLKSVISAASPLVLGCVIAFIVNILMSRYESWFFPKKQSGFFAKIRRPLCMVFAFLTAILVIALVVWLIVPQLVSCIQVMIDFAKSIPSLIKEFTNKAENWNFIPKGLLKTLSNVDWESKIGQFITVLTSGVGGFVNTVAKTLIGVFSGIVTAIIGIIFSIYLLLDKDRLKRQFKKLAENYMPKKAYEKTFYLANILNDSFRKFIVGQLTEAVILGFLCTLGMMIFRLPYATMIGALIAFTALIPVAGAYIGAITGALMILTVSPAKALGFIIFILILQQLEGNIIYPRVVGSSIGLPGLWVLAAVTVGGGCFGILGMLIGVPLASALYRVIREDVDKKTAEKEKALKKNAKQQKTPDIALTSGDK